MFKIIILVLQVETVKINAATVEVLKKKERQGETQFTTRVHLKN
jgi:hypothetical protein